MYADEIKLHVNIIYFLIQCTGQIQMLYILYIKTNCAITGDFLAQVKHATSNGYFIDFPAALYCNCIIFWMSSNILV